MAASSSVYSISTLPKDYRFALPREFLDRYHDFRPFKNHPHREVVFIRSYSRLKPEGDKETYQDVCERVINGCYRLQYTHISENGLGWDHKKALESAEEMFDRMIHFKFQPPGRSMWAMGSDLTEKRALFETLCNCSFVSTENIALEKDRPFCFFFDVAMLGVGITSDTRGSGKIIIYPPVGYVHEEKLDLDNKFPSIPGAEIFPIPDSREGWVEALHKLLLSYFEEKSAPVDFDYSLIRPEGTPIKGFGGTSEGYKPLKKLLEKVRGILHLNVGKPVTTRTLADIFNRIAECVVAGNIRRVASMLIGDPSDEEFLNLKNYAKYPDRASFGWTSNNTILADGITDFSEAAKHITTNGEPGFIWLQNAREYSRMVDKKDYKDMKSLGSNPCGEQTLENYEMCNLVVVYPQNCTDKEDFKRTLKFAYLYGKTVTLGKTHWPETNRVMLRNRRIGLALSGITQFLTTHTLKELQAWCEEGYETVQKYDVIYSDWLAIPRSIKTTTIKPDGTMSLITGSTPGIHFPESRYCIRRIIIQNDSDILPVLREAGYVMEPSYQPGSTVVEFYIDYGPGIRTLDDASMWEQLSLAAFFQRYWSDNQVSVTITFDAATEAKEIPTALTFFRDQLKSVSMIPKVKTSAYKQLPFEPITEKEYLEKTAKLRFVDFAGVYHPSHKTEDAEMELFCDGDKCMKNMDDGHKRFKHQLSGDKEESLKKYFKKG